MISQRLKDIASESGPQWHSWRDYVAAPTSWYIRTEADAHADKLKRALIVAAEVIEKYEKVLVEECFCTEHEGTFVMCDPHEVLSEAQKMMEGLE